ncbi:hypothetical protein ROA7450_03979 [Roseovarius albus]|uniref:Uncharacterized protein n=1 Tax=Roseovarius albus TaxID=1247867 RepID=A0A1X7A6Z1_9RHOB|nr:hypothetical protein ROA7450_03979 [Roseovarius albus]
MLIAHLQCQLRPLSRPLAQKNAARFINGRFSRRGAAYSCQVVGMAAELCKGRYLRKAVVGAWHSMSNVRAYGSN